MGALSSQLRRSSFVSIVLVPAAVVSALHVALQGRDARANERVLEAEEFRLLDRSGKQVLCIAVAEHGPEFRFVGDDAGVVMRYETGGKFVVARGPASFSLALLERNGRHDIAMEVQPYPDEGAATAVFGKARTAIDMYSVGDARAMTIERVTYGDGLKSQIKMFQYPNVTGTAVTEGGITTQRLGIVGPRARKAEHASGSGPIGIGAGPCVSISEASDGGEVLISSANGSAAMLMSCTPSGFGQLMVRLASAKELMAVALDKLAR